jgi:PRTRC genetic system protein A
MLVHHHLATTKITPPITAPLYEYIFGGNGVFKRARRDLMSATIPVCNVRITGLEPVEPEFTTSFGRVPETMVARILDSATEAARHTLEALFYLSLQSGEWRLEIPRQIQTYRSVEPCEKGAGSPYERAIIEIHSHHRLRPVFSPDDDRDETGFRIYGVIGSLNPARDYWPAINLRLGVYGDWWPLQADRILEMPPRLLDHNSDQW